MFSRVATFVLSIALIALADPTPSTPSPGQVFKQGGPCPIEWDSDKTGVWKTMNIELMTGDNLHMVHLTTITSPPIDGTASPGTFSFTCPEVTIPAPIYFYQFSSPSSPNLTWTTRFTISSPDGTTVPAPNGTQPDGSPIPWGTGALLNPSTAVPPPGTSSVNGTSATNTTTSVTSSTIAITPKVTPTTSVTSSTTPDSPAPATASQGANGASLNGNNSSGALMLGAMSARASQACVTLAVIAATFTFMV
ncbi:hypothetical protein BC826DRAFT_1026362 [Russula brevipes]|nr:hypothetical protein BC826DRAFT_1026362 [Russula brevipes]